MTYGAETKRIIPHGPSKIPDSYLQNFSYKSIGLSTELQGYLHRRENQTSALLAQGNAKREREKEREREILALVQALEHKITGPPVLSPIRED